MHRFGGLLFAMHSCVSCEAPTPIQARDATAERWVHVETSCSELRRMVELRPGERPHGYCGVGSCDWRACISGRVFEIRCHCEPTDAELGGWSCDGNSGGVRCGEMNDAAPPPAPDVVGDVRATVKD